MNIVWLVSNYPHVNNTGAGVFHLQSTQLLAKKGHQVTVIAPTPYSNRFLSRISSRWGSYLNYPRRELIEGILILRPRYLALPGQNYRSLTAWLMYFSLRDMYCWKEVDIVDAHYAYPYGMVAKLLAKMYSFHYVVSLHGDDVNIDPYRDKNSMKRFIRSISDANLVQAVSRALAEKATTISSIPKIATFNLGLNLKLPKERMKPSSDVVTRLLYVGALTRDKGMHLILALLQASEYWRSERFEWILVGEGEFSSSFVKFNNVKTLGQISNQEVLEEMKRSTIFIFPSLNEGMPHVLKEAGSIGLPIVSSDVGGIPELLDFGERGWIFERDNLESLKTVLEEAISNYNYSLTKANLLQDYVHENYNINHNVEDLIIRYKKILGH